MIFANISTTKMSKAAWETLEKSYQGITKVKTIKLHNSRGYFESLKMKESQTIEQFMDQVTNVVSQMRLLGDDFEIYAKEI